MKRVVLFIFFLSLFSNCNEEKISLPKPRMFPKIDFPVKYEYHKFDQSSCPFHFDYPSYGEIKQSKEYFKEERNDCWFDVHYSGLKATLYCSYSDIESPKDFKSMVEKNYLLVNKHNRRADFINENFIVKNDQPVGIQFEIEGEVATPFQFFLTDTTNHFFRASLYFNSPPNQDSLAPIYQFVKNDINQMIGSFEWE